MSLTYPHFLFFDPPIVPSRFNSPSAERGVGGKKVRKGLVKIGIGLLSAAFIWVISLLAGFDIAEISTWYLIPLAGIGFAILTIIGIPVLIYGIIAEPKQPTEVPRIIAEPMPPTEVPEIKARVQKTIYPTFRLMSKLKFGALFIVVGFLMRLFLVNVVAKEIADAETIITGGDWLLVLFAVIGILIIGFGIAEFAIAKKKLSW